MAVFKYLFAVILFSFCYSCAFDECTSKSLYISSFDGFIEDVEHDYRDYSEADWEKAQLKFDRLTGECYEKFEKDFTSAEERKIFKYTLKYSFYKLSSQLPIDLKSDEIKKFSGEVEKMIDKEKDISKILEKVGSNKDFEKAADDFKRGMEHFGTGLKKIGAELEKIFEDIEKNEK